MKNLCNSEAIENVITTIPAVMHCIALYMFCFFLLFFSKMIFFNLKFHFLGLSEHCESWRDEKGRKMPRWTKRWTYLLPAGMQHKAEVIIASDDASWQICTVFIQTLWRSSRAPSDTLCLLSCFLSPGVHIHSPVRNEAPLSQLKLENLLPFHLNH